MVRIDIRLTLSSGARSALMKIDRSGVHIKNGRGTADVDPALERHRVTIILDGPAGAALDYDILQDEGSLAKGKVTVSFGFEEGAAAGWFKLRAAR